VALTSSLPLQDTTGQKPLVSVFTASYEIGAAIDVAHQSLLRQSYETWEWVVVDDSVSPDTAEYVMRLADHDPAGRIRLYRQLPPSGSIGANKSVAAGACHGEFLVELDHDDELLPAALETIVATFLAHPDVDFLYSDSLDWRDDPDGGGPVTYPAGWGLGFGAYASEMIDGRRVPVVLSPPLTWETVRHIVAMPNHVRAWRASFYREIGGHDWRLPVADDYELVLRTFLNGVIGRIPRPLYVQHHDPAGSNASRRRNGEIQRRVQEIADGYRDQIDRRCTAWGVVPSLPRPLTNWRPISRANATLDVLTEAASAGDRPLVSVVVPTHRRPESLRRAIASILAQTYEHFEVLVVGDACPDVDAAISVCTDERVRHWNLPERHDDSGAGPRNYALKAMARGSLVAYLDDDNVWREDHLASLVRLLLEDPRRTFAFASMVYGGETIICRRPRHLQIDTSALLHKRFLLDRFGYWRGRDTAWFPSHDWELVLRWRGEPWVASLEPTLTYTLEESSQAQRLLAAMKVVADEELARVDPSD
jgi:glycosyltransferase involved in cell wall biosynthesis